MKPSKSILLKLLAAYLLVLPVLFYGIHIQEHEHDLHNHEEHNGGACIVDEEVNCSLCDSYLGFDSFLPDYKSVTVKSYHAITHSNRPVNLLSLDSGSVYLRGPPVPRFA